jgi:hypothetical protein
MDLIVSLYLAALFFILSPNVLFRIPQKGSVIVVAAVHACAFAVIYHFTYTLVWKISRGILSEEGFREGFREGYKFGQYVCGPPSHPCQGEKYCIDATCTDNPDF